MMIKHGYWRGRARSFRYAGQGIRSLFEHEPNAQFHLGAAVIVIAAGILLKISTLEWCAVSLCIGGVFMAEAFNTAIEKLCDYVCPDRNPLIGKVKDLAAGAVLLFVAAAVVVGLIVFLPKLVRLI